MTLTSLTAISPIDGRYRDKTAELAPFFSEMALMRYRVKVEVEYLLALAQGPLPHLWPTLQPIEAELRKRVDAFNEADAVRVKTTEATTNHDVKAVEYLVKSWLEELGAAEVLEFVHFGLTSQDINNTAVPLMMREGLHTCILPLLRDLQLKLKEVSTAWENISMLAHTHGQPASPTRLGKEMQVFLERYENQLKLMKDIPFGAKFGGATGNMNAHVVTYPETDWKAFANAFVNETLGLSRQQHTTQIEHYDNLSALLDSLKRVNTIGIDMAQDMWLYISMDYFRQKIKAGEVGSSAMPHKVNPIDFENAEGNFGMANAVFEYVSRKLPVSRLQRDLTDSTVVRNLGVPMAHTVIALKSLLKGLDKLVLNEAAMQADLENNWAVLAEAIQTVLRREGYPKPYEALRDLTRGNHRVTQESLHAFIDRLEISASVKEELKSLTPQNYTGLI